MKLHMYHSTRGQSIIEDVAPVNATFISQWSKESANSLWSVQQTIEPKMAIVPHVGLFPNYSVHEPGDHRYYSKTIRLVKKIFRASVIAKTTRQHKAIVPLLVGA